MDAEGKFTHLDDHGIPRMVDVSAKALSRRTAVAEAEMLLPEEVRAGFRDGDLITKKGSVFHTAIIAGTQAVKKTADLIPFCHAVAIEHCRVDISMTKSGLLVSCEVATTGRTGVEMEAITGATIAALTVYDMCKSISQDMEICSIQLIKKSGGKTDVDKRGKS